MSVEIDKYLLDHFGFGGDNSGGDDGCDDGYDDTKIYKANELLFAIDKLSDLEDGKNFGFDMRIVVLVPIDFWEAEHCMCDFIGGHNVDNDALRNGGMCEIEESEGVFEFGVKTPLC